MGLFFKDPVEAELKKLERQEDKFFYKRMEKKGVLSESAAGRESAGKHADEAGRCFCKSFPVDL